MYTQIGRLHLVLVEGEGKKIPAAPSSVDTQYSNADTDKRTGTVNDNSNRIGVSWTGRTDTNKRVVFPASALTSPVLTGLSREEAEKFASLILEGERGATDLGPGLESVAALVRDMESERARGREGGSIVEKAEEQTVEKGSYVVVKIIAARGHTLR